MICPNCGKEIEEGQKFCTSCGTELDNIETNNNNVATEDDTKTKIIVILICFAILVFATILGILVSKNQTISMTTQLNDEQSTTSIVNCDDYENLNVYDEKYASGYIECTLDEKIKKLNAEYKFKEQERYWEDIDSVSEHVFYNTIIYENRDPKMYGKYDTIEKLEVATYKEYTIFSLGEIALGLDKNCGPDSVYNGSTWEEYLEMKKNSDGQLEKLNNAEQYELALRIQKLTKKIKNKFYSDYYRNVYIEELMGIEYNIRNEDAGKIIKTAIDEIYNPITNDFLPELTKEAKEKAKAIEAYNNLVIDNVAFAEAYQKARAYADEHIEDKDENGTYLNAGTGSYEGLIGDYFEEYDKQFVEVYDTIFNYCGYTTDCGVDERTCLIDELEKLTTGEK